MTFNTIVLCASAFLVQSIAGQCLRSSIGMPAASCGCNPSIIVDNGGSFIVTSVGPVVPSAISAAAELALAADLAVYGTVPFLSAVAFDGQFQTSGSAPVSYGCGDGNIAITQEIGNSGSNSCMNSAINSASSSGLSLGSIGLGSSSNSYGSCSNSYSSCACGSRYY